MRSSLDKISTLVLRFTPFVLAFFTPLFFLPFTADYFTFNKFYLVTFLASLSLLAWCVRNLTRGKLSFTASPSFFPLLLLVIAHIISSVWLSSTQHTSLFGQTTLFISFALIFITTTSTQKNQTLIDSIVYGFISSATILSLFSILQHFGIAQRIFQWGALNDKFFSLTGGILPTLTYVLPVAVATVGMSVVTKKWISKSILFAAIMIMIVAAVINISLLFPQDKQPVIALLPYTASWSITVDIMKNWRTALLGTGPETYLTTFTRLRPQYLNMDKTLWNLRFGESGSYLLTLITTTGILGGLAFALALLRPIFISLKHKKQIMEEPTMVFLTIITVASFIVFLLFPAGITSVTLVFASLIGLTVAYKILGFKNVKDISFSLSSTTEHTENYSEITTDADLSLVKAFLPWVTTVLSVTLVALYWYFAIPAYQASVAIKQASDMVQSNTVGSFMKQAEAVKLDKYNPNYQTILSQTYQSVAKYYLDKKDKTEEDKKNAIDSMQRAVDAGRSAALLDPYNVNSYENLAGIYQSFIGNADGAQDYAVSHLAQAVQLDPTNPRLRLQLGILFFNLGDSDQATRLISQAIELKGDWDIPFYNMASIYKSKKDYVRALQYMKAGFALTDPKSEDYTKVQEEIKSLEKLAPTAGTQTESVAPTATSSAKTK